MSDSEAVAQLAMDMDRLGLTFAPQPTFKPDPQLASALPSTPAPTKSPGVKSPVQGGLYGPVNTSPAAGGSAQSGFQNQNSTRLKYSGKLPTVGTDVFDLKDMKALRDFSKNLNKRLPLESLLERYVDFLASPSETSGVKYYTSQEIKKHLGGLIPEEALIVYDALVRDPNVDLNCVFYTLASKFGAYKKVDSIREQVEMIMNDTTTPVLEVLGQLEILYNSIQGVPISSVQEEAMYSAMKFLKKRLGAGFAQQVKISRIAYEVKTIRDLILMVTEEFSSIIEEGADKDLLNKIEKSRFHSILSKANEVDELHQNIKSMVECMQSQTPPPPQFFHAMNGATPQRPANYPNNTANNYNNNNAYPTARQQPPRYPKEPANNFRPGPPPETMYKNKPCGVAGHTNHTNNNCRYQQQIPCNYSANHRNHNASDCRRIYDHVFGLTRSTGSKPDNNNQQQQQPQDGRPQYQQRQPQDGRPRQQQQRNDTRRN